MEIDLLNLNNFKYFFYVVKYGGYSKAAVEINVSQPALSFAVKKLESELGITLIKRAQKKFELTEEGFLLYKKLKSVKSILFENANSSEKIKIGTIRVAADSFFCEAILKFQKKFPQCKIEVAITESRNLYSMLSDYSVDAIVDRYAIDDPFERKKSILLGQGQNVFACSKEYYQQSKELLSDITKISQCNFALPNKSKRRRQIDEYFARKNFQPNVVVESPTSSMLKQLVLQGNLIGYFTQDSIKQELADGSFVTLDVFTDLPSSSLYLTHEPRRTNQILNEFIKILHEVVENNYK